MVASLGTILWQIIDFTDSDHLSSRMCMALHICPLQHQASEGEEDVVQVLVHNHCIGVRQ
jgi:hypothetical protein